MEQIKEKSCWIIPFTIIDGNIKFLIVKHNQWHWWFPKWHIEKWETEIQTAKRELMEETWINNVRILDNCKFTEEYETPVNWEKIDKIVVYFLWEISIDNLSNINIIKSELSDYLVDSYDNLCKIITYDSSRQILKKMFYFLIHNKHE
jgi:8-oxo-dGTP pyrophosphatase MutT (NUDIX family)